PMSGGILLDRPLQLRDMLFLDAAAQRQPHVSGIHRSLDLEHLRLRPRKLLVCLSNRGATEKASKKQRFTRRRIATRHEIARCREADTGNGGVPGSGIADSEALEPMLLDPEGADLPFQRRGGEAESRRGARRSGDASATLDEGRLDDLPLARGQL